MNNSKRAALLASSGTVLASLSAILGRRIPAAAGFSADFWRGVPIVISIVVIVAALIMLARSNRRRI